MTRLTRTAAAIGALTLAAIGLSACASGGSGAQADEPGVKTLLVATGASPKPYTYLDENDKLTGYDIELLRLIDEKLPDIAFKFEVADFPALFAGLDSGRFNVVANNLSATDERRKKYDFSDPYIEAQFGITVPQGSPLAAVTTLDQLAGKKAYGEAGLNFTKVLEAYNAQHPDKKIDIEYTELDLQTQYKNLAAGVVDFAFSEKVVSQGYGGDPALGLAFVPLDGAYLTQNFGTNLHSAFAFSKATDQSAQIAEIDRALKALIADGTVSELSKKFFDGVDVTPQN